jgi:hypothetical protein
MLEFLAALGIGAGAMLYQGHLPTDQPYYTTPPMELTASGLKLPGQYVSICYSSAVAPPERIAAMVAAACEHPQFIRNDYVGDCTIAAPVRVTYKCSKVNRSVAVQLKPYGLSDPHHAAGRSPAYYRTLDAYTAAQRQE